ncbi:MAG: CCA tRNA nucleotidyltransferase [Deltaproteobacteria bacterium]|nr:CCA tRNA nucleotidyltransferase [Deltaproteobacteria bacterium]MBW2383439.1 CCA tRNA nucleotidyltransferase [Deltaproteobacteria bacterium]
MSVELGRDEILQHLPIETLESVESVVAEAERIGARVLLVGGPVRDLLLHRPIRDVDLLIEPEAGRSGVDVGAIARAAAAEGARVVEHSRFGTVRLEAAACTIDIAHARRECYERPGALPQVEPGTLEEDLLRRDFTVNALAVPLGCAGPCVVIDPANGLRDLADRRLRVLHPRSFHDDPTRALRAARLAPRLGFSLARDARSALRGALRDGAFGAVSGDRLRREIEKCFSDAAIGLDPASALRQLADWHVLPALEPGLGLPRESLTALRRLGRAIAHPLWRTGRFRPWVSGLDLWLAPQSPALRRRTLRRFSVRGDWVKRIADFPALRDKRLAALEAARGRGAVDALLTGSDEEEVHALYCSAPPAVQRRIVRWAAEDRARRLPVSGHDLLALGLSGPALGRLLGRIRAALLDGEVANREEAIALAEEIVRSRARGTRRAAKKKAPAKRSAGGRRKATRRG